MTDLKDKTLYITGASCGIGKAIALWAARDSANHLTGTVSTPMKRCELMPDFFA